MIRVRWEEKDGLPAEHMVTNAGECQTLLLRLYQSDFFFHAGESEPLYKEEGLVLGVNRSLFANGREVFRFSLEHYQEELEQMVLDL